MKRFSIITLLFSLAVLGGRVYQVNSSDSVSLASSSDNESNKPAAAAVAATTDPASSSSEAAEYVADCKDRPVQLKKSNCAPVTKQRRATVGGHSEADPNDPKLLDLVKNAWSTQKEQPDAFDYELVKIKSVKVQTVAGSLHTFELEMKDHNSNPVDCQMKIWYRPWIGGPPRVVTSVCGDRTVEHSMRKRSICAGCPGAIDNPENDVELQTFVESALTNYNSIHVGLEYGLHKITEATRQVVAGILYKITIQVKRNNVVSSCQVSVWDRPWIPQGRETTLTCEGEEELKFRSRRSLKFDHRRPLLTPEAPIDNTELHTILFNKFVTKYNRKYQTTLERQLRFRIFRQNMAKIEEMNARERGTAKYGVNGFADMMPSEFRKRLGLIPRTEDSNHIPNPVAEIPDIDLPESFDWRDRGVISQVKNQGACGSCWAFSVIGNIEGLNAIKTGQMTEFSEQELVDCDTTDKGCSGGLPDNAYKAIEELGGLEYESEYPYTARQGHCNMNKSMVHVQLKGAVDLPKDEVAMAKWLVANGPISIGLNANAMQFYRAGISHPYHFLCRASNIDHGVLIVGFGVANYPVFNKTMPYWIVKNSWGPDWGEKGYYRIFRGDNSCGINSMASSAVLD